jgi:ParB/Sulfiredoxin domain
LLLRLEHAPRSALEDHVHRAPRLGERGLLNVRIGIRPPWRNARIHSNKQIRQIANSIRQFGWTSPIVTDENKQIIAGFGRFKAAEQLGLRKVPVIVVTGLNEVQKRALALAETKLRRPRPGIVPFSLPNWASSPFYFPNTILASISPASSQQRSTL